MRFVCQVDGGRLPYGDAPVEFGCFLPFMTNPFLQNWPVCDTNECRSRLVAGADRRSLLRVRLSLVGGSSLCPAGDTVSHQLMILIPRCLVFLLDGPLDPCYVNTQNRVGTDLWTARGETRTCW